MKEDVCNPQRVNNTVIVLTSSPLTLQSSITVVSTLEGALNLDT